MLTLGTGRIEDKICSLIDESIKRAYLSNKHYHNTVYDIKGARIISIKNIRRDDTLFSSIALVALHDKDFWVVKVKKSNDNIMIPVIDDLSITHRALARRARFIRFEQDTLDSNGVTNDDIYHSYINPSIRESVKYGNIIITREDDGFLSISDGYKALKTRCLVMKLWAPDECLLMLPRRIVRTYCLSRCLLANYMGTRTHQTQSYEPIRIAYSSATMIPVVDGSLAKAIHNRDINRLPPFEPYHIITTSSELDMNQQFVQILHYMVPLDDISRISRERHLLTMKFSVNNRDITVSGIARRVMSKKSYLHNQHIYEGNIHISFDDMYHIIHNRCYCKYMKYRHKRQSNNGLYHYIAINPLSQCDTISIQG